MSERLVASGTVLVGRYELHDQVGESLGASHWRAHDRILKRNVGIELLPSDDPRADHFIAAAKASTAVTDHHFLRVLDVLDDEDGFCVVVREWAKATSLDKLLSQAPLTNQRAAEIIGEVAAALANAHALGVFHRRLAPHHVMVKQSGAVRIVGLGVADALSPADHEVSPADLVTYERLDVEGLGRLLYASLVGRWPGGQVDGLRAAPTRQGRLLTPRQVRAGVSRDLDSVCSAILGAPSKQQPALGTAADVARALADVEHTDEGEVTQESPAVETHDVLRLDPVVLPSGPPPGLEPPRRRPRAYEPAEPTLFERGKRVVRQEAKGGDRLLLLVGVLVTLALLIAIGVLVNLASRQGTGSFDSSSVPSPAPLPVQKATDLDPYGGDGVENPELAPLAIDGNPTTGWYTSTYYNDPHLGRLKPGVGLVLDLGQVRAVTSVQLLLQGQPTSFTIYVAPTSTTTLPRTTEGLISARSVDRAGATVSAAIPAGTRTRFVVVWLRSLPEIGPDSYRGEIREVTVRGH